MHLRTAGRYLRQTPLAPRWRGSMLGPDPRARCLSVDAVTAAVAPLQHALEAAHAASGLSWPVFIPAATIGVRAVLTAPLAVWNRVRSRRQRRLAPLLAGMVPVLKAQLAQSVVRDHAQLKPEQIIVLAAKERRRRRVELYREFKCQNWKVLLLPAVQIPVFVAMSLAVRSLVGFDLSTPTEFGNVDASHFLWFRNLVEPDPYGVVPLAIGACSLANVEMNARAAPKPARQGGPSVTVALANMSRAGSIVFMALAFQAPMALELYWLSSNAFSLVQNLLLDRFLPVSDAMEYPRLDPRVMDAGNVDGDSEDRGMPHKDDSRVLATTKSTTS